MFLLTNKRVVGQSKAPLNELPPDRDRSVEVGELLVKSGPAFRVHAGYPQRRALLELLDLHALRLNLVRLIEVQHRPSQQLLDLT